MLQMETAAASSTESEYEIMQQVLMWHARQGIEMVRCNMGFVYGKREVRVIDVVCRMRSGDTGLCFVFATATPRRPTAELWTFARECTHACEKLLGLVCSAWILNVPQEEGSAVRRFTVAFGARGKVRSLLSGPPVYTEKRGHPAAAAAAGAATGGDAGTSESSTTLLQ
jgi:hypothetical protein